MEGETSSMFFHNYCTKTAKWKSRKICSVPQCSSRSGGPNNISLHKFPNNTLRRRQWAAILKMGKIPKNAYACSNHFDPTDFTNYEKTGERRHLKPTANPTKNVPKLSIISSPVLKKKQAAERAERIKKRADHRLTFFPIIIPLDVASNEENSNNPEVTLENSDNLLISSLTCGNELMSSLSSSAESSLLSQEVSQNTTTVSNSSSEVEDKCTQANLTFDKPVSMESLTIRDILTSDSAINAFTGLQSMKEFMCLCNTIDLFCARLSLPLDRGGNIEDFVFIALCKLKTNMTFRCIAELFHISLKTCLRRFRSSIEIMYKVLQQFIYWPPQKVIANHIPSQFARFPKTRIILDCTEIKIQKSKCLKCRIKSYSQYKHDHTVKVMIGMSPNGAIIFISKCYGGRISDKQFFNISGLLDLLEEGNEIMVDKGFLIEKECSEKGIKLIRPPFLRAKSKFSQEEAELTKHIASARVHVERVIQRIKNFDILKGSMPWFLLSNIDEIVGTICGLVNLSSPIIRTENLVD